MPKTKIQQFLNTNVSKLVFLSLVTSLFSLSQSVAHPLDVVYFEFEKTENSIFKSCLNVHPSNLQKHFKTDILTEELFKKNTLFRFFNDNQNCKTDFLISTIAENDVRLCYESTCEPGAEKYSVQFDLLDEVDDEFSIIGKFKENSTEQLFRADNKNKTYSVAATNSHNGSFFNLGLEHLGASIDSWKTNTGEFQVADGIDHILFLIALLLVSISLKSLVINITGFTIGHSISLALSLAQILVLPAAYIEPAIAVSIAYLATRGVLNKKEDSFKLTVFFGLLHGMGFSYILQNLNTQNLTEFFKTLLLFNLGIEAGQLIILLFLTPLFLFISRSQKFGKFLKIGISVCILAFSAFWAIERINALFK